MEWNGVVNIHVRKSDATKSALKQTLYMGGLGLWEIVLAGPNLNNATLYMDENLITLAGLDVGRAEEDPQGFFTRYIHPDDLSALVRNINECISGTIRPYRFEHRIWNDTERKWRWYSSFGTVSEYGDQGEPLRLAGALQDVHQWRTAELARRKAEWEHESTSRQLERQKMRLDAIAEMSELGVWDWDVQSDERTFTPAYAAIAGYTPEELLAEPRGWRSMYFPSDLDAAKQLLNAFNRGDSPLHTVDFRLRHKNGSPVWVQERGKVTEWDAAGKPKRVVGILIDCTSQRRAELELLEKCSLEKNSASNSNAGQWTWHIREDRLDVSDEYLRQLGLDRKTFANNTRHWMQLVYPEEQDSAAAALQRLVDGKDSLYINEIRLRHSDGRLLTLYDIARVTERDSKGNPITIAGTHFLAIPKNRLQPISSAVVEFIAKHNSNLDRQLQTRRRVGEQISQRVAALLSDENTSNETSISHAMSGMEAPPVIMPDVTDVEAFADYLIKVVNFIANRIQWYVTIIDTIPVPMQIVDNNKRWVYTNQASRKVFPDIHLGDACGDTNLCNSDFCAIHTLDKDVQDFTVNIADAERVYQGRASWLKDTHGQRVGHVHIMHDITELVGKQKGLLLERDQAEASARAKSEFLANMSHEVRTPMNAVLGLCHLLRQSEMNDIQCEYVERIQAATKSLLRIINDILDFSKIEAGKMDMVEEDFDLERVIEGCIDLLSERAHGKGLELILDLANGLPTLLVGDASRLAQILTNLLTNAVKFTSKGEITLSVKLVEKHDRGVKLCFLVRDTGIGLDKKQIGTLFDAFTQADATTTRRYGGTGLGLAISKRLVEMMGGAIWCDSNNHQGSTFGFTAQFGLGSRTGVRQHRHLASGIRVLLVEDNPSSRIVLKRQMTSMGFVTTLAESGEEALAIAETGTPHYDAVMVDALLPGMDGFETAEKLQRCLLGRPPIILMIPAGNRVEVVERAKKAGVRKILSKPMSPSAILNAIMDVLGRTKKNRRSLHAAVKEQELVTHLRGSRILLAEDNEVNQLVAKTILSNAGFVVDVATTGLEAVEKVRNNKYDIVIMDIQMPEMDGLEATVRIRAIPGRRDLPIIAMTANAMSGDREASLKAGMNAHISKPIDVAELFRTLADILAKNKNLVHG